MVKQKENDERKMKNSTIQEQQRDGKERINGIYYIKYILIHLTMHAHNNYTYTHPHTKYQLVAVD